MSQQPLEQSGVPLEKVAQRMQERLGAIMMTVCALEIKIEEQGATIQERDERIQLLEERVQQMAKEAEN